MEKKITKISALLVCLFILIVSTVSADVEEGLYLTQNLGASLNPLGISIDTSVFYRTPLIEEEGILWESTKTEVGIENSLTPAFDSFGVFFIIEPIAVFDIKVAGGVRGHYNIFGFGYYPLSSYSSDFDNLDTSKDQNRLGYYLSATPTLKAALGPIIIADSFTVKFIDMKSFGPDISEGYYNELVSNTVAATQDIILTNNLYGFYQFNNEVLAGLNYNLSSVPAGVDLIQRLVLMGVLSLPVDDAMDFTGVLQVGGHLQDRYNLITDGKVYVAIQVGVTAKL